MNKHLSICSKLLRFLDILFDTLSTALINRFSKSKSYSKMLTEARVSAADLP